MEENLEDSEEGSVVESLKENISDVFFDKKKGESSDSDTETKSEMTSSKVVSGDLKAKKVYRPFGRENSVHCVLGGGKAADLILWRNKFTSAFVLTGVTTIWILFELLDYYLVTLVCHCLILGSVVLFIWSKLMALIDKTWKLPDICISEDTAKNLALSLRFEINRVVSALLNVAIERDLRKFLGVIAGLWVISIVGSCYNFLTLFYTVFVLLHTMPVVYEKYEDKVDFYVEKAMVAIKENYAILAANVLSGVRRGLQKVKKH